MKAIDMLNQIKETLGIELSEQKVELATMTLENGTEIQAESFEPGQQVFIVSDSEDSVPLPIGEYTLGNSEGILSVTEEGIIGEIKEAGGEEPAEEEASEVEASEEDATEKVKSEETTTKVVYATKEEYENLSSLISEIKTMLEANEAPAVEENVNDIELAAEAVEEISHNPESVSTEAQSTFENVTVSRAKYLNNLVNQFNQE